MAQNKMINPGITQRLTFAEPDFMEPD